MYVVNKEKRTTDSVLAKTHVQCLHILLCACGYIYQYECESMNKCASCSHTCICVSVSDKDDRCVEYFTLASIRFVSLKSSLN